MLHPLTTKVACERLSRSVRFADQPLTEHPHRPRHLSRRRIGSRFSGVSTRSSRAHAAGAALLGTV
jgi:hypothetical protein